VQLGRTGNTNAAELADTFCRESRKRIETSFREMFSAVDVPRYRLAQSFADGEFAWLERLGTRD
jgi:hypothetical protein